MKTEKKLYRVNLRGFGGYSTGVNYKHSYVVADDAQHAYSLVRKWLDDNDYGFTSDRALESVELLAEAYEFSETKTRLFLS